MLRVLLFCLVLISAAIAAVGQPAFIVLSSTDSVTIKLTEPQSYTPGTNPGYEIRRWPDGETLTKGSVDSDNIKTDESGYPSFGINGLHPELWSPQDPRLYEITVTAGSNNVGKVRFGFRTFEAKNRKLYLNGRPVFLRGMPINPPGRDLPEATGKDPKFIRDYLRLVKSAGVNLIRTETQEWLDACDEIGLMTLQGRYGPAPGEREGKPPTFEQARPFYRNMLLDLASHPSVIIYVLTNEVNYKDTGYKEFLAKIREDLRLVDPTRPVIGNAGFGGGEPGEIFDIHRYAGWYQGNLCDWYDLKDFIDRADKANQPLTMSECVGAYTSDSGIFETMSKQLSTSTKWIGGAEDPRAASLEYQAELVKQIVEIGRRMRTDASGVASIMPFTYFLGWANVKKADDLIKKPAFDALKTAFQPVLLSPECWNRNIYAGDKLSLRLCVVNDDDSGRDIAPSQADVEIIAPDGRRIAEGRASFPAVPYYSNAWADLSIPISTDPSKGYYEVKCSLSEKGRTISTNQFSITIAPRDWAKPQPISVTLYDPSGNTASALKSLGVKTRRISSLSKLPANGALVIGEEALDGSNAPSKAEVQAFLNRGGRILCLRQAREKWSSDWLPAEFTLDKRRQFTYMQPVGNNAAIMNGLSDRDLRYWDELGRSATGTPDIYPVISAFKPNSVADLKSARVWAACDQLLGSAAIVEIYAGKGSIVLNQFRCTERVNKDPIAAKLLGNLISYAVSNDHPGLVDLSKPVKWTLDAFKTGVFMSPLQGMLPRSPVYKHTGGSKGMLGNDHTIDGFTLVGDYGFNGNGWITPVPDPTKEGWGVFFGTLSKPAARFGMKVRNASEKPGSIKLEIDGTAIGIAIEIAPGASRTVEWDIDRKPGPVQVGLRGDQDMVILESWFK